MGQISRTTNPTGLREIHKRFFVVRERNAASSERVFWLERFDYEAAEVDASVKISCIAHAGNTEEYFDLGTVSDFIKSPFSIQSLAADKPLRFRFIFNRPDESLLIGYTDGIRALDEAGQLGSSLVDIEPTDLRGITWKLTLPECESAGEKPNVLVERSLFPTAQSAVNHPWFGVLVMPEVMRQIALRIAQNPDALEDSASWISPWADFIAALSIDAPNVDMEEDDNTAQSDWADSVVEKFCLKGIFRHHLALAMAEMNGEQK